MLGVSDAQNRCQAGVVSCVERNFSESSLLAANPPRWRNGCHPGGGAWISASRMGGGF
ncbi:unnamed protein product [Symbiodinium natans]|uniref:Uncharacterized protein n=1 Tax=Symbiodinium natans TaxID=878477 RepID=A0A812ULJ0_9DINO|nr:unnamed protein product [Symbiodinium natans]